MGTTLISRLPRAFHTLLLSLAAVGFTLAATELTLRISGIGAYSVYDRVLFYTFPAFVDDGLGSVRYAPRAVIREVAIFGAHIDYDRQYSTNNLGFLDSVDYTPADPDVHDVVFIGDSFTAGTGGYPWVPDLRKRLADPTSTRIYNLGVGSASIHHIDKLLSSFRQQVGFDEVNILVISNDFFRPFWRPIQRDDSLWFCPTQGLLEDCSSYRRPIIHRLSPDETAEDLRARATEIYTASRGQLYFTPSTLQQFHLYTLACDAYHRLRPSVTNLPACPHLYYQYYRNYEKNPQYHEALDIIRSWPEKYPGVRFRLLHIPEKAEAAIGRYTLEIGDDLRGTNIEFVPLLEKCRWTKDMYYKHDLHPTIEGYRHLRDCVAENITLSSS